MVDISKKKKVMGKKQTIRAIVRDEASMVLISKDADAHVIDEVIEMCKEKNIEIVYFNTMRDLGKTCEISVNAAAAAVLK